MDVSRGLEAAVWNRQRRLFVDSSEIDPAIGKVHRDRPH